jgi:hypothetical protein
MGLEDNDLFYPHLGLQASQRRIVGRNNEANFRSQSSE